MAEQLLEQVRDVVDGQIVGLSVQQRRHNLLTQMRNTGL
jgi:hypothetical protein